MFKVGEEVTQRPAGVGGERGWVKEGDYSLQSCQSKCTNDISCKHTWSGATPLKNLSSSATEAISGLVPFVRTRKNGVGLGCTDAWTAASYGQPWSILVLMHAAAYTHSLVAQDLRRALPLPIDLPSRFGDESREGEPVEVFILLQVRKRDQNKASDFLCGSVLEALPYLHDTVSPIVALYGNLLYVPRLKAH